jgi:hypothetical protein
MQQLEWFVSQNSFIQGFNVQTMYIEVNGLMIAGEEHVS